ncbi:MAG: sugar-binding protein [Clostridia bacterium]|nr:sugar-binding protein [Clostridia bacterium]
MNKPSLLSLGVLILGLAAIFFFVAGYLFIPAVDLGRIDAPESLKNMGSPQKTEHFMLIAHEYTNPYWARVRQGAEDAAKELGITIEYVGPKEANLQELVEFMEMAIAAKADGIITYVLNDKSLQPYINKAMDKGIPVITVDTDAPGSKRVAYVGTNNYRSGLVAGEVLAKATGGYAKVGIISGDLQASNQILRVEGIKEVLRKYPGMEIMTIESSHITRMGAAQKTQAMLKKYPEIKAIVGTSALDAIGIAQAVAEQNRSGQVIIVGYDDLPETLEMIKAGTVYATIVQKPYQMGYLAVKMMHEVKQGKRVSSVVYTGVEVVTKKQE